MHGSCKANKWQNLGCFPVNFIALPPIGSPWRQPKLSPLPKGNIRRKNKPADNSARGKSIREKRASLSTKLWRRRNTHTRPKRPFEKSDAYPGSRRSITKASAAQELQNKIINAFWLDPAARTEAPTLPGLFYPDLPPTLDRTVIEKNRNESAKCQLAIISRCWQTQFHDHRFEHEHCHPYAARRNRAPGRRP